MSKGQTHAKEPIALKLIVTETLASSIIGTGGCNVKELMARSKTNISVSQVHDYFPGTSFRTIIVSGTLSAVSFAQSLVCIRVARLLRNETPDEDAYISLDTLESVPSEVMSQWISVKVSIPDSAGGLVIGKAGACIKAISDQSSASVSISDTIIAHERLVHIDGSTAGAIVAINMILEKLISEPRLCRYVNYTPSYKMMDNGNGNMRSPIYNGGQNAYGQMGYGQGDGGAYSPMRQQYYDESVIPAIQNGSYAMNPQMYYNYPKNNWNQAYYVNMYQPRYGMYYPGQDYRSPVYSPSHGYGNNNPDQIPPPPESTNSSPESKNSPISPDSTATNMKHVARTPEEVAQVSESAAVTELSVVTSSYFRIRLAFITGFCSARRLCDCSSPEAVLKCFCDELDIVKQNSKATVMSLLHKDEKVPGVTYTSNDDSVVVVISGSPDSVCVARSMLYGLFADNGNIAY